MKHDAPFEYLQTKDRGLIAKYVELRRRAYLNEYPWLPPNFGYEDDTDRDSFIVLVRRANLVAGGARLTISTPPNPRRLPLEEAGFSLEACAFLSDLDLHRNPYGEISRMAVDAACSRGLEASFGLGNALCAIAAREGLDVVFSICPDTPARINQINAKRRGIIFHKYCEMPTVFGRNMWLCAFTGLLRSYERAIEEVA